MRWWFALAFLPLLIGGCDKKKGGAGGGGGSGGGAWLIAKSGLMLNVDHEGRVMRRFSAGAEHDLLAIACRGEDDAFVAGRRGTLLVTWDGGASWRRAGLGVAGDLTAVAVAGLDRVFVIGDAGLFLVSDDNGATWRQRIAPNLPWTSVATTATGDVALLATAGGALYRYDATRALFAEVGRSPTPLAAVALSADGRRAVAVGAAGTVLESDDGARSFRTRGPIDPRALHDVWLTGASASGVRTIVVGEALLVGDLGEAGLVAARAAGPPATLRGLHLSTDGSGLAVGDGGRALLTRDAGRSWAALDLGEVVDFTGVDALFGEPHL